ncbi:MAG: hypothetical protein AB7O26_06300 [Planctomycetaceae bacterium]
MKSLAMLLLGVSLALQATGCCGCLSGCNPCGSACGYSPAPVYGGGCSTGQCSPGGAYPAVVPQGAFFSPAGAPSFAAAPARPVDQFASASPAFAQTAMAGPLDPLPTY